MGQPLENLSLGHRQVLNSIRSRGSATRNDISEDTDISPTTVFRIVSELLENEFILSDESASKVSSDYEDASKMSKPTKGPEPVLYRVNPEVGNFLGVGVGSKHVILELIDFDFRVKGLGEKDFRKETKGNISSTLEVIQGLIDKFIDDKNEEAKKIIGIGFAWPGAVDNVKGIARFSPNINFFREVRLSNILTSRQLEFFKDKAIVIEHNTSCLALAEKEIGNCEGRARHSKNFVSILLGSGIAAGLFLNNELYRGAHNYAGELGHIVVDENSDVLCKCGKKGCLQTKITEVLGTKFTDDNDYATQFENLNDDDRRYISSELGRWIGKGISYIINLFNPEVVVFGGYISELFDSFYMQMDYVLKNSCWIYGYEKLHIEQTKLGRNGTAIGAAIASYRKLTT